MANERVQLIIDADAAALTRELRRARGEVGAFGNEVRRQSRGASAATAAWDKQRQTLRGWGDDAARATKIAAGIGAYGLFKAAKDGVAFNATMESNQVALTNLLDSGEKSTKMLQNLWKTAKETPFEFTDITEAAKKFLAFGFSVQGTEKALGAIGDAVAAMGGGAEKIDRITLALGQVQAKGKVYGEELLQLTEAGIPAQRILREELNLTADEMANIGKLNIPSEVAIDALITGMNKRFGGMAKDQSKTWQGLTSTMKDNWAQMTGAMTQGLFKELKHWGPAVNRTMEDVGAVWRRKDLSFEDKFKLSRKKVDKNLGPAFEEIEKAVKKLDLPEKLADGFSKAVPKVAEAAGKGGLVAAKAFLKGFLEADALGRLVAGAWVINKFGGFAALRAAGMKAGAATGAGYGAGMTATGMGPGVPGIGKSPKLGGLGKLGRAGLGVVGGPWGLAAMTTAVYGPDVVRKERTLESDRARERAKKIVDESRSSSEALKKLREEYRKLQRAADTPVSFKAPLARAHFRKEAQALKDIGDQIAAEHKRQRDLGAQSGIGLAKALAKEKQMTKPVLNSLVDELKILPPEARKAAAETVTGMASEMERKKKLPEGSTKKIARAVIRNFSDMRSKSVGEASGMSRDMKRQIDGMASAVSSGMGALGINVDSILKAFGVDKKKFSAIGKATKSIGKSVSGLFTGKADGGWVGNPGERGRDEIPAMLGRGEAVANAHQQAVIEPALQQTYGFGLDELFKRHNRPHYLASGGYAGGVKPPMAKAIKIVTDRFPLTVTSTTGGGHAAGSYHYKGEAADFGGSPEVMRSASQWIKSHMGKSLTEGIHNPNLSVKHGKAVPSSFWGAKTWANHSNHIHLAIAGALRAGGIAGGEAQQIARTILNGPDGALKTAGQGALDLATAAANQYLSEQSGAGMAGDLPTGLDSIGGNAQQIGKRMLLAMGWGENQWPSLRELWTRESNWNPRARNPSSGAYGIPQSLPASKMASAGEDWASNAATQIKWGLSYIKGRYGSPAKALAFHTANNWYGKGGWTKDKDGNWVKPKDFGLKKDQKKKDPKKKKVKTEAQRKAEAKSQHQKENEKRKNQRLKELTARRMERKAIKNRPRQKPFKRRKIGVLPPIDKSLKNSDKWQERLSNEYDLLDREYNLTEDNPLKTIKDADGNDVEVRDEEAIAHRAGELDQLIYKKTLSRMVVNSRADTTKFGLHEMRKGIKDRFKAIRDARERMRNNIRKIERLIKRVRATKDKTQRKVLHAQIGDLRKENVKLGGSEDHVGKEGLVGRLTSSIGDWREQKTEWKESHLSDGYLSKNIGLDIRELEKEKAEILGTVPPKQDDKSDNSEMVSLLKQQLEIERTRSRVSEAGLNTFAAFQPLLTGRLVGSFARGGFVPETGLAQVHKDELIISDPNGPFRNALTGGSSAPVEIILNMHGDAGQLIQMVDARVDGRAARIVTEQLGRRQRLIAAGPGRGR